MARIRIRPTRTGKAAAVHNFLVKYVKPAGKHLWTGLRWIVKTIWKGLCELVVALSKTKIGRMTLALIAIVVICLFMVMGLVPDLMTTASTWMFGNDGQNLTMIMVVIALALLLIGFTSKPKKESGKNKSRKNK